MEDVKFSELASFQAKQLEAQEALNNCKYLLYGGAAGGGKSYWLRWMAVRLLMYYFAKYNIRGVRVGLFCEDYPALKERHLSKISFEFPEWIGKSYSDHKDHGRCFILNGAFGGGVLVFRNLDDPSKYLSSEFAAVLVDELTKNKRDIFDFLVMRLRWPGIPDTKFLAATNPGEIGHGWVKKLWINKDFSNENHDPNDFNFIQSLYSDNKYIDASYEKQLGSLPDNLRRAYKDGDWDVFAGQYFTEFRRDIHVCDPFQIPDNFPVFGGLDYGYTAPSAALWCAYDRSFDTVYVYDELYEPGLVYEDLGREIKDKSKRKIRFYADPALWAKKDQPKSGYDELKNSITLSKANNSRVTGANLLRKRLKSFNGRAKLVIFSNCKNLIRTLPELVHCNRNPEDVDTNGEDHAYDALRYAVSTFFEERDKTSHGQVRQVKYNSYGQPII